MNHLMKIAKVYIITNNIASLEKTIQFEIDVMTEFNYLNEKYMN